MQKYLTKEYRNITTDNFWIRKGYEPVFEPDDELKYIEIGLANIRDRSVLSTDVIALQKTPKQSYFLSGQRCNLLRPFEKYLQSDKRVLELGCECGVITRYFGECGAEVCAVEENPQKAAIAALRCYGMRKVHIINDQILKLPIVLGKFDIVTVINGFCNESSKEIEKPEIHLLEKAKSFLRKNGVLILVTENKFGLKRLAGVPGSTEKSCWETLTTLNCRYGTNTYTRKEVVDFIQQVGFTHHEQFVPISDYRKTSSVVLPKGLYYLDHKNKISDIFDAIQPFDEQPAIFNLQAAWQNAVKGGLVHQLADSLCFFATTTETLPENLVESHLLAVHFGGLPNGEKKFGKDVAIYEKEGTLLVKRKAWFPELQNKGESVCQILEDEPFHEGKILLHSIRQATLQNEWNVTTVAETFRPWIEFLQEHRDPSTGTLPKNFLDCCPINIIDQSNGNLVAFDLEWSSNEPVPFELVLVRGIFTTLERLGTVAKPANLTDIFFGTLIQKIAAHFGWHFSDDELADILDRQNILGNFLFTERPAWEIVRTNNLKISLGGMKKMYELVNQRNTLQRQIVALQATVQ